VIPLTGYVDRLSARPGERIAVKVSSQSDQPYRADLVRIIHADANPAGPGIKLEEVVADFTGTYASCHPLISRPPRIARRGAGAAERGGGYSKTRPSGPRRRTSAYSRENSVGVGVRRRCPSSPDSLVEQEGFEPPVPLGETTGIPWSQEMLRMRPPRRGLEQLDLLGNQQWPELRGEALDEVFVRIHGRPMRPPVGVVVKFP
jgi:hypothetical protein